MFASIAWGAREAYNERKMKASKTHFFVQLERADGGRQSRNAIRSLLPRR